VTKERNSKINEGRRKTLKYLYGISLLSVSGCNSCLKSRPDPQIKYDQLKLTPELTYLQPISSKQHIKSTKYCIDVHAHFFNASDVNVKGYVEGPIARTLPSGFLRKLARSMAGVLHVLSSSIAPSAAAEYNILVTLPEDKDFYSKDASQRRKILQGLAEQNLNTVTKALYDEMLKQKADADYMKALKDYRAEAGLSLKSKQEFSLELIRESIDLDKRSQEYVSLAAKQQIKAMEHDPRGLIEFCIHMLSPRWVTLLYYQDQYTNSQDSFGVDAVFGSLVDFDYWLDCIPPSSRDDQMKLHSLLSKITGGYMLPIISYNPWTDIKHDDASFKLLKTAIEDYGFIGVKIYPANGFYPYGNTEISNDTSQRRPNLELLDEKLSQMFAWCAKQRIPVMAHTSESMGSDDASDQFGGPVGWNKVLDKFKEDDLPVINAGHFGGDEAGEGEITNWTAEFGKIMKLEQGKYFYGDLGYWSKLEQCGEDCEAKQRLRQALKESNNIADKRIMYGTDWLMSSKEPNWQDYPEKLQNQLDGILNLEKIFYKNALECFGLNKGGAQREKIEKLFIDQTGGLPNWLEG